MRSVAVAAVALLLAACGSTRQTAADDPSTTTPISPTYATVTTTPVTGAVECGTFDLASGWPTTMAPPLSTYQCLETAFTTGQPARLVLSVQTDGEGGSPVTTTFLVTGQGIVHVTVDATEAADRPRAVTTQECRSLVAQAPVPTVGACENVDS